MAPTLRSKTAKGGGSSRLVLQSNSTEDHCPEVIIMKGDDHEVVTVGRADASNKVVFPSTMKPISRKHCIFERRTEKEGSFMKFAWYITDTSHNGIVVVPPPNERTSEPSSPITLQKNVPTRIHPNSVIWLIPNDSITYKFEHHIPSEPETITVHDSDEESEVPEVSASSRRLQESTIDVTKSLDQTKSVKPKVTKPKKNSVAKHLTELETQVRNCKEELTKMSAELQQSEETGRVRAHESLCQKMMATLEEDFTCVICFKVFLEPVSLSCGHTFCHHCISQWLTTGISLRCPVCRDMVLAYRLPLSLHLKKNIGMAHFIDSIFQTVLTEDQKRQREIDIQSRREEVDAAAAAATARTLSQGRLVSPLNIVVSAPRMETPRSQGTGQ